MSRLTNMVGDMADLRNPKIRQDQWKWDIAISGFDTLQSFFPHDGPQHWDFLIDCFNYAIPCNKINGFLLLLK